ncbi:MAG: AAA family ATPase [Firmicutes bacterium]|nr:AAA family ATPase [Bacillota bacterium]
MQSIPARFMQAIQLHLIRNFWRQTKATSSLILGIAGAPGQGKSYQCRQALDELGYKHIAMSTSDFGSALEAESAKNLCAKYVEASMMSGITQQAHALIIDDVDMGLGNFGGLTQYTVNLQYAIGEIMHLCDCPTLVKVEPHRLSKQVRKALGNPLDREIDVKTNRIPIFVTGNDFTKLYEPLLRDGRMTTFNWVPSQEEQISVVAKILPNISESDCKTLVMQCTAKAEKLGMSAPAISFYAALKNATFDEFILKTIKKSGWIDGFTKFVNEDASIQNVTPSYQEYLAKAEQLLDLGKQTAFI